MIPVVDFELARQVGAQAFLVFAALQKNEDSDGLVRMTQTQVGQEIGVSRRSAQISLQKLIDFGLLKCEQVNGHTNTYRIIRQNLHGFDAGDHGDHPQQDDTSPDNLHGFDAGLHGFCAGSGVSVDIYTSSLPSTTTTKKNNSVSLIPETPVTAPQSGALRAPLHEGVIAPTPGDHAPRAEGAVNGRKPLKETISRKPGTSWGDFDKAVETLVAHFERPVVERQKAEYARRGNTWRGKGLDGRRESWREDAIKLLEHHSLAEVVETVDFVFDTWGGYLPTSVKGKQGRSLIVDKWGRPLKHDQDLKVTRLRLIRMAYDSIRDHMANPEITAERWIPPEPKPSSKAHRQSDVDELVTAFTEFRASVGDRNLGERRLNGWTKTFRILLRQHSAEEIRAVIAALRGCPDYVDQQRYRNAFDLTRPGEWEDLQGYVQLHQLSAEQNKPLARPDQANSWRPGPSPLQRQFAEFRKLRHQPCETSLDDPAIGEGG